MAKKRAAAENPSGGAAANLGFQANLWGTADTLRNNMDAAEYKGRAYDPCFSSGGMVVQREKFVKDHGGRIAYIGRFYRIRAVRNGRCVIGLKIDSSIAAQAQTP